MERMEKYLMSLNLDKEKRNVLEKILEDFLKDNNIGLIAPVDVFALATELGFDVRGAEFEDSLDGIIIVNERVKVIDCFTSNKIIMYNCKRDIYDKKFNVAHELAHYIYEKRNQRNKKLFFASRDHSENYSEDEYEQQMDYLAAAILIPKTDFERFFTDSQNSEEIANRYKVNKELAERRVSEIFG